MITLTSGTYSSIALTLAEHLDIEGLASSYDISSSRYYAFRIENKSTRYSKAFLPRNYSGTTPGSFSGDLNAGTFLFERWNEFEIGVNTPSYASSYKEWDGEIELEGIEDDWNDMHGSQWIYEVWACAKPQPAFGATISIPDGSVMLEAGRMRLK